MSPVSDAERLQAIFEEVTKIRSILQLWSTILGISFAVVVVAIVVNAGGE